MIRNRLIVQTDRPLLPPRRRFLQQVGVGAGLLVAPAFLKGARTDRMAIAPTLFTLGVASGDPDHQSVVLWTRLAPEPLTGGGLGHLQIAVEWQVAVDPAMIRVIRRGTTIAAPEQGYTIQVVADRLPTDRWLYYRVQALGETSRIGRTRTFPEGTDRVERMRFAVASCQDIRTGFYTAYRDMVEQDLDFVVHVGDYIYEEGLSNDPITTDRNHNGGEAYSIEDYRNRYAQYRLDPLLQEVHARLPFIAVWDDHEVADDYAGLTAKATAGLRQGFAIRRRNAYQVYSELTAPRPEGRGFLFHRGLPEGKAWLSPQGPRWGLLRW